jgi:hypothetical protein
MLSEDEYEDHSEVASTAGSAYYEEEDARQIPPTWLDNAKIRYGRLSSIFKATKLYKYF